ncbi:MAG: hypothetical protein IIA02_14765 [Proteobacteria bacterium]|uniref:hypothetical protein n=1 Tax=Aquabacterium sp. TaxID=1872578 RepID=UPI0035C6A5C2|nr:hypothetical protein [Pseudomonadota bacterium]
MKALFPAAKVALLNVFFFGPTIYAALNRTRHEFFYGWLWPTGIAFVLMVTITAQDKYPDEDGHTGFKITHGHIFGSMLIGLLIYTAIVTIGDVLRFLWLPQMKQERALLTGGLLALAGGAALFAFRLKCRAVYSLSEATVGTLIAAQRFSDPSTQLTDISFFMVFLTAGIYLVVRGLDNMHQGLTKPPIDPLAKKFLASIRAASTSR